MVAEIKQSDVYRCWYVAGLPRGTLQSAAAGSHPAPGDVCGRTGNKTTHFASEGEDGANDHILSLPQSYT